MSKQYHELVGLQVTFDKVVPRYHLVHYYRREQIQAPPTAMVMRGYDMDRKADIDAIVDSLRKAYEPAVLSIWQYDTILSASEYLQFQVLSRPDEVGIEGDWTIVP